MCFQSSTFESIISLINAYGLNTERNPFCNKNESNYDKCFIDTVYALVNCEMLEFSSFKNLTKKPIKYSNNFAL